MKTKGKINKLAVSRSFDVQTDQVLFIILAYVQCSIPHVVAQLHSFQCRVLNSTVTMVKFHHT